jgi:STE24 endopeptidase
VLGAGWLWVAWQLWDTTVPAGLDPPELDAAREFDDELLAEVEDYERVVRWLFIASQVTLLAVLAVYARAGVRFVRESAAGPIGTGFLIGMMGLALVWLAQLPFDLVELWWTRRHDVLETGYLDFVIESFFALGAEFLFICLALLVAMALARVLRSSWWLPAAAVFVGLAALFTWSAPYLTPGLERPDRATAADGRQLSNALDLPPVPVKVQEVREFTSSPNAYAFGLGESRRIVLWDTFVDGPFPRQEVRWVMAHELGHHKHGHLATAIAWFALLALPGALAVALVTRRRGGLGEPAAVPVALLALVVLSLVATPLQSASSRRYEAEADWAALEATRDPHAMESLARRFTAEGLADPDPPGWFSAVFDTHPSGLDRIAMARAWARDHAR